MSQCSPNAVSYVRRHQPRSSQPSHASEEPAEPPPVFSKPVKVSPLKGDKLHQLTQDVLGSFPSTLSASLIGAHKQPPTPTADRREDPLATYRSASRAQSSSAQPTGGHRSKSDHRGAPAAGSSSSGAHRPSKPPATIKREKSKEDKTMLAAPLFSSPDSFKKPSKSSDKLAASKLRSTDNGARHVNGEPVLAKSKTKLKELSIPLTQIGEKKKSPLSSVSPVASRKIYKDEPSPVKSKPVKKEKERSDVSRHTDASPVVSRKAKDEPSVDASLVKSKSVKKEKERSNTPRHSDTSPVVSRKAKDEPSGEVLPMKSKHVKKEKERSDAPRHSVSSPVANRKAKDELSFEASLVKSKPVKTNKERSDASRHSDGSPVVSRKAKDELSFGASLATSKPVKREKERSDLPQQAVRREPESKSDLFSSPESARKEAKREHKHASGHSSSSSSKSSRPSKLAASPSSDQQQSAPLKAEKQRSPSAMHSDKKSSPPVKHEKVQSQAEDREKKPSYTAHQDKKPVSAEHPDRKPSEGRNEHRTGHSKDRSSSSSVRHSSTGERRPDNPSEEPKSKRPGSSDSSTKQASASSGVDKEQARKRKQLSPVSELCSSPASIEPQAKKLYQPSSSPSAMMPSPPMLLSDSPVTTPNDGDSSDSPSNPTGPNKDKVDVCDPVNQSNKIKIHTDNKIFLKAAKKSSKAPSSGQSSALFSIEKKPKECDTAKSKVPLKKPDQHEKPTKRKDKPLAADAKKTPELARRLPNLKVDTRRKVEGIFEEMHNACSPLTAIAQTPTVKLHAAERPFGIVSSNPCSGSSSDDNVGASPPQPSRQPTFALSKAFVKPVPVATSALARSSVSQSDSSSSYSSSDSESSDSDSEDEDEEDENDKEVSAASMVRASELPNDIMTSDIMGLVVSSSDSSSGSSGSESESSGGEDNASSDSSDESDSDSDDDGDDDDDDDDSGDDESSSSGESSADEQVQIDGNEADDKPTPVFSSPPNLTGSPPFSLSQLPRPEPVMRSSAKMPHPGLPHSSAKRVSPFDNLPSVTGRKLEFISPLNSPMAVPSSKRDFFNSPEVDPADEEKLMKLKQQARVSTLAAQGCSDPSHGKSQTSKSSPDVSPAPSSSARKAVRTLSPVNDKPSPINRVVKPVKRRSHETEKDAAGDDSSKRKRPDLAKPVESSNSHSRSATPTFLTTTGVDRSNRSPPSSLSHSRSPGLTEPPSYYREMAVALKREGDKHKQLYALRSRKYLESGLMFLRCGAALEATNTRSDFRQARSIYAETIDILQAAATLSGHDGAPQEIQIISLRCMAVVNMKIFNMRQEQIATEHSMLTEAFNGLKAVVSQPLSSPWSVSSGGSSNGGASPSPSPAAAGANGSSSSNGAATSTTNNQITTAPAQSTTTDGSNAIASTAPTSGQLSVKQINVGVNLCSFMRFCLDATTHWRRADRKMTATRSFFADLNQRCVAIHLMSPITELVEWGQKGLDWLDRRR